MIEISTNVAIASGSALVCAGFLLGYAIGWRQRDSSFARELLTALQERGDDLEARVRRSQT